MRQAPSIVPGAEHDVYLVLEDFGDDLGRGHIALPSARAAAVAGSVRSSAVSAEACIGGDWRGN
jgi:hypothetical protein